MRIDSIQLSRGLYQVCMKGIVDDKEVTLYAVQEYDADTGKVTVVYTQYGIDYDKKKVPQDWVNNLNEVLEFITRRF